MTVLHTLAPWWEMVETGLTLFLTWVTSYSQGTEKRVLLSPKVSWHLAHLYFVPMWPWYSVLWGLYYIMDVMVLIWDWCHPSHSSELGHGHYQLVNSGL